MHGSQLTITFDKILCLSTNTMDLLNILKFVKNRKRTQAEASCVKKTCSVITGRFALRINCILASNCSFLKVVAILQRFKCVVNYFAHTV